MTEVVFWTCGAGVVWCYIAYPLVMILRSRHSARPALMQRQCDESLVSVVLAVRNEEGSIERRVRDLLSTSHPTEQLEVLIVCNGCTDDTLSRARRIACQLDQVAVHESPSADGKAGAINLGVERARGEFIVFADARQTFAAGTVEQLIQPFADPDVGAVTGRLVIEGAADPAVDGVRMYWNMETALRLAESRTGSVVGATGAVYAIRRSLFEPLPPNTILDDVMIPMNIALQGFRIVMAEGAVAFDVSSVGVQNEYRRKLRTMLGNLQLIRLQPRLLSPRANPLLGRFISHKLLRVFAPLAFLALIVSAAALPGGLYRAAFVVQLGFYTAGVIGLFVRVRMLALPAAFLLVHIAAVEALFRWRSDAGAVWARPSPSPSIPDTVSRK